MFKCRVCKTHTCEAHRPSRCPPTSALQPGDQLTEPRRPAAPCLSSAAGNPKNPLGSWSSDPSHCYFNSDKNKAERTKQTCGCRHGVWTEINLHPTYGMDCICLKSLLASLCLDVYWALPTMQPHPSSALRTDENVDTSLNSGLELTQWPATAMPCVWPCPASPFHKENSRSPRRLQVLLVKRHSAACRVCFRLGFVFF